MEWNQRIELTLQLDSEDLPGILGEDNNLLFLENKILFVFLEQTMYEPSDSKQRFLPKGWMLTDMTFDQEPNPRHIWFTFDTGWVPSEDEQIVVEQIMIAAVKAAVAEQ